ncbi:MAG: hypothetical protein K9W45_11965 [Candidatus Heimdallarchaeum aukensis]|uniref:Peptidase C14 caspase domain-containing protein n=1 Tax=Candidatus Heimdallarchaeum aukensis TaxID=2876573 RepID=A0A9Y1BK76_9ARCH|nr:MAG: hypothetical protein K9W45_11965 [Candidatus Heimdallarchaeum aukensis]
MKKKITIFTVLVIGAFLITMIPLQTQANVRAKPLVPPGLNKAPTVSIDSPSNGDTVSGVVTILVSATDKEDGDLIADIYIDGVFIVHANQYDWDTTAYADGSHTIEATATDSGGQTGSDTISVTVANDATPPPSTEVEHWAVLVGISDYKAISDLSYCDEDATDWYNYLNGIGYEHIVVLGDGHTDNYPKYDGLATEYNVKQALQDMVASADSDDVIAFISSGHGSGNGRGSSYLCMWDCSSGENGEDGNLYDTELAAILDNAVADRIFVFLDHCYSGGFGDDLMNMPNSEHVYLTTTCTERGYGYDDSEHQNGMWTYYFLEYTLIGHFNGDVTTPMEDVFDYAFANYPKNHGVDAPQEFDGNTALFYIW